MSLGATFYQLVARRFSTVLVAVTAGAYIMNYTFNGVTDAYWDAVSYFLFIYLFLLLKSHAYIFILKLPNVCVLQIADLFG